MQKAFSVETVYAERPWTYSNLIFVPRSEDKKWITQSLEAVLKIPEFIHTYESSRKEETFFIKATRNEATNVPPWATQNILCGPIRSNKTSCINHEMLSHSINSSRRMLEETSDPEHHAGIGICPSVIDGIDSAYPFYKFAAVTIANLSKWLFKIERKEVYRVRKIFLIIQAESKKKEQKKVIFEKPVFSLYKGED